MVPQLLVWNPVYKAIEERINNGDDILLIIVPFAKLAALQQLDWVKTRRTKIKIVCRWAIEDLASGVSDVEVFTYLKALGCELYVNAHIHLKLYVFESNFAFATSGNLTLAGLGYSAHPNVEVGNMVQLTTADWARIYQLIASSRQVDDLIYERVKDYLESMPQLGRISAIPDLFGDPKRYTIASLPATDSPTELMNYYLDQSGAQYSADLVRRAAHDLVTFGTPDGLRRDALEKHLASAFKKTPFVVDFVELLKVERSLRFGAVNDWIHRRCEDVPLPYRWEIKENTCFFYNWLAHCFPEITWDRPNYSQVIYWDRAKPS